MNDDRTTDEPLDDDHATAVIAADDTGMIAGERTVVVTEIVEGLDGVTEIDP